MTLLFYAYTFCHGFHKSCSGDLKENIANNNFTYVIIFINKIVMINLHIVSDTTDGTRSYKLFEWHVASLSYMGFLVKNHEQKQLLGVSNTSTAA